MCFLCVVTSFLKIGKLREYLNYLAPKHRPILSHLVITPLVVAHTTATTQMALTTKLE